MTSCNRMKSRGLTLANSLSIEGLHAGYGEVRVLTGIDMNVRSGETVVLLGTNGNGKSTLIKCIMGQVRPSAGRILATIEGETLRFDRTKHRRNCPAGNFTRSRRPAAFSEADGGRKSFARCVSPGRARAYRGQLSFCFDTFPRLKERRRQQAGSMSGGEQQMLAIARALMALPKILLVDEPSVGLAPILVSKTIETIAKLQKQLGLTVLMAEQNFRQAIRIADRGYVLVHGQIVLSADDAHTLRHSELVRRYYLGVG